MAKYIKKPVVVEATQWWKHGDSNEVTTHYWNNPKTGGSKTCKICGDILCNHGWVDTLEGGHIVCPSDWIITGVKGENYSCKDEIFKLTYSPVGE